MELSSFEGSGMTRVSSDVRGLSAEQSEDDWGIKTDRSAEVSPRRFAPPPFPKGLGPSARRRQGGQGETCLQSLGDAGVLLEDGGGIGGALGGETLGQSRVLHRQDLGGEQGCVGPAAYPDRGHRDARGHLHGA